MNKVTMTLATLFYAYASLLVYAIDRLPIELEKIDTNDGKETDSYANYNHLCSLVESNLRRNLNELLKDQSLDINARDQNGSTALHFAVSHMIKYPGRVQTIKILLLYGADVNALDKQGNTPLMLLFKTYDTREHLKTAKEIFDILLPGTENIYLLKTNEILIENYVFCKNLHQNQLSQETLSNNIVRDMLKTLSKRLITKDPYECLIL